MCVFCNFDCVLCGFDFVCVLNASLLYHTTDDTPITTHSRDTFLTLLFESLLYLIHAVSPVIALWYSTVASWQKWTPPTIFSRSPKTKGCFGHCGSATSGLTEEEGGPKTIYWRWRKERRQNYRGIIPAIGYKEKQPSFINHHQTTSTTTTLTISMCVGG